jgi:hypothetical protein
MALVREDAGLEKLAGAQVRPLPGGESCVFRRRSRAQVGLIDAFDTGSFQSTANGQVSCSDFSLQVSSTKAIRRSGQSTPGTSIQNVDLEWRGGMSPSSSWHHSLIGVLHVLGFT